MLRTESIMLIQIIRPSLVGDYVMQLLSLGFAVLILVLLPFSASADVVEQVGKWGVSKYLSRGGPEIVSVTRSERAVVGGPRKTLMMVYSPGLCERPSDLSVSYEAGVAQGRDYEVLDTAATLRLQLDGEGEHNFTLKGQLTLSQTVTINFYANSKTNTSITRLFSAMQSSNYLAVDWPGASQRLVAYDLVRYPLDGLGAALKRAQAHCLGRGSSPVEQDSSGSHRARSIEGPVARAKTGDAEAQYQLGMKHELGNGVPKDRELALFWYAKAAAAGHNGAKDALKRLAPQR